MNKMIVLTISKLKQVKSSVLFQYFKAGNIIHVSIYLIFFSTSYILMLASNFWLSEWSNKVNETNHDTKLFNYLVYLSLGVSSGKNILIYFFI